jgi:hypothetical protein
MPNTIHTLAPTLATSLKSVRSSLDLSADMVRLGNRWSLLWLDSLTAVSSIGLEMWRFLLTGTPIEQPGSLLAESLDAMEREMARAMADVLSLPARRYERTRHGEAEFLKLFCEAPPCQSFHETGKVLVDLPACGSSTSRKAKRTRSATTRSSSPPGPGTTPTSRSASPSS